MQDKSVSVLLELLEGRLSLAIFYNHIIAGVLPNHPALYRPTVYVRNRQRRQAGLGYLYRQSMRSTVL